MAKITRKGSGRTKGSYSFTGTTLGELIKRLRNDPAAKVTISRKYAESQGWTDLTSAPATTFVAAIEGVTPQTTVGVTETNFNETKATEPVA